MVFLLFVFSKEFEHTKLALREFRQRRVIGGSESREITGEKDNISSAILSKVNHIVLLLFYLKSLLVLQNFTIARKSGNIALAY